MLNLRRGAIASKSLALAVTLIAGAGCSSQQTTGQTPMQNRVVQAPQEAVVAAAKDAFGASSYKITTVDPMTGVEAPSGTFFVTSLGSDDIVPLVPDPQYSRFQGTITATPAGSGGTMLRINMQRFSSTTGVFGTNSQTKPVNDPDYYAKWFDRILARLPQNTTMSAPPTP